MPTSDMPGRRSRPVSIRRYASAAEADRHDHQFWVQVPEAERVLEVWRLSEEQWQLATSSSDEPRLSRSIARVHRR